MVADGANHAALYDESMGQHYVGHMRSAAHTDIMSIVQDGIQEAGCLVACARAMPSVRRLLYMQASQQYAAAVEQCVPSIPGVSRVLPATSGEFESRGPSTLARARRIASRHTAEYTAREHAKTRQRNTPMYDSEVVQHVEKGLLTK